MRGVADKRPNRLFQPAAGAGAMGASRTAIPSKEPHMALEDSAAQAVGENAPDPREGLASRSFISLAATQTLGALNDNIFRWLAVPVGTYLMRDAEHAAVT